MKTLQEIVDSITKNTSYSREVVEFHVERIAKKFKYELSGKKNNLLSKEDAADVESIATRFFQDRKKRETIKSNATQLLPIIGVPAKSHHAVKTTTKPLPIIPKAKKSLIARLRGN